MSKKGFFDTKKARPEEGDFEWRQAFEKKMIRPYKRALRHAIEDDNLYRVQYLLETYPKKFQNLETSLAEHYYISCHMVAMRDERNIDILKTLLNETDFTTQNQKTEVLKTGLLSSNTLYAETVFDYFRDHALFDKAVQNDLVYSILAAGRDRSLALFINAGVEIDDPTCQMMMKSIENGRLNTLRMLVTEYDAEIMPEHVSEAERLGQFEIAEFLRETDATVKQQNTAAKENIVMPEQDVVTKKPVKSMSSWELIGEDAVIHMRSNAEGTIKITDLYDFSQKNVTRSQYLLDLDVPPTVTTMGFDALDGSSSVMQAFNLLAQKLGKEPKISIVPENTKKTAVGPSLLPISHLKN